MNFELIRPVAKAELMWELMNRDGMLLVAYSLTMNSKEPLDVETVKKALYILPKKIPSLGACIKEINGQYLFCKQDPITIDFEVCNGISIGEVVHKWVHVPLDSHNGPMWRARLILPPQYTTGHDYPHQSQIVFVFNHSLTDGTTNVAICKHFLSILNDVIDQKEITPEPFAPISDGRFMDTHFEQAKRRLLEDPDLYAETDKMYKFFANRKSLVDKLPPHIPPAENSSCFITKRLDQETTRKLIQQFKDHKVTFHSGLTAHINKTIIRLLEKRDLLQKQSLEISCTHIISTRRYDQGNENKFGTQVGVLNLSTIEPRNSADIWLSAKRIGEELQKPLNDRLFGLVDALVDIQNEAEGTHKVFFELNPEFANLDYSTSNMGNISSSFSGNGKHVMVDTLFRQSTLHQFGEVFHIICHTFRGRLHFTVTYIPRYMSKNVAEELSAEFTQLLTETASECTE